MFFHALANGLFQVALFTLIPFVCWLLIARKNAKFFSWLGVKKIKAKDMKKWWLSVLLIFFVCLITGELAVSMRGPMAAADSQYAGMGAAAIPSILAYAFIQTALSEEILFRGFLLKRLAAIFGFKLGNLIQAAIFGTVHLLMVWGQAGFLPGLVIVVYPMIPAVLFAWINEKMSDGSILPSWLLHGLLNTVTGIAAAVTVPQF